MLKNVLIVIGILIGLVVVAGAAGAIYLKPTDNRVLNYIKKNPDKAAILLVRNDSTLVSRNPTKVMPLASTVKIVLTIEYAIQSAAGKINADELIPLSDLDKFYIPNTDGNAHPNWLKSVKSKIKDDKISIREITRGMIMYSSNANTEWLLNKLGRDNVNARLTALGTKNHTEIYDMVSALFIGKEKFPTLKGKELEENLRKLDLKEYINTSHIIHKKLLTDSTYKKNVGDLGLNIQRVWSDNLPSSSVSDYVEIMKKINSRTYFNKQEQEYLDDIMEFLLQNPENKKWLAHAGMKGGSTAFVLTKALYATDCNGNKTELAYFINDISFLEMTALQMSMNEFELQILRNPEFRELLKTELQ